MLLDLGRIFHARCKYYVIRSRPDLPRTDDGWCLKKFFVKSPFAQNEKSKLI